MRYLEIENLSLGIHLVVRDGISNTKKSSYKRNSFTLNKDEFEKLKIDDSKPNNNNKSKSKSKDKDNDTQMVDRENEKQKKSSDHVPNDDDDDEDEDQELEEEKQFEDDVSPTPSEPTIDRNFHNSDNTIIVFGHTLCNETCNEIKKMIHMTDSLKESSDQIKILLTSKYSNYFKKHKYFILIYCKNPMILNYLRSVIWNNRSLCKSSWISKVDTYRQDAKNKIPFKIKYMFDVRNNMLHKQRLERFKYLSQSYKSIVSNDTSTKSQE